MLLFSAVLTGQGKAVVTLKAGANTNNILFQAAHQLSHRWQSCVEMPSCAFIFFRANGPGTSSDGSQFSEALKRHIAANVHVSPDFEDLQKILVRRSAVWKTAIRCLRQPTFDGSRGLSVRFIGEEAVDAGGPLREFFRLLIRDIATNGSLVCGPENHRTAVHNNHALHHHEFKYVGQAIALSILFGGPGPHFFAEPVANYLLDLPIGSIDIGDLPDMEVAEKVKKVLCFECNLFGLKRALFIADRRLQLN